MTLYIPSYSVASYVLPLVKLSTPKEGPIYLIFISFTLLSVFEFNLVLHAVTFIPVQIKNIFVAGDFARPLLPFVCFASVGFNKTINAADGGALWNL